MDLCRNLHLVKAIPVYAVTLFNPSASLLSEALGPRVDQRESTTNLDNRLSAPESQIVCWRVGKAGVKRKNVRLDIVGATFVAGLEHWNSSDVQKSFSKYWRYCENGDSVGTRFVRHCWIWPGASYCKRSAVSDNCATFGVVRTPQNPSTLSPHGQPHSLSICHLRLFSLLSQCLPTSSIRPPASTRFSSLR
jgi:hypothetical protein